MASTILPEIPRWLAALVLGLSVFGMIWSLFGPGLTWRWLPVGLVPLKDAAVRAYEQTRYTDMGQLAELGDEDRIITWYAGQLQDRLTIFGRRMPEAKIRALPDIVSFALMSDRQLVGVDRIDGREWIDLHVSRWDARWALRSIRKVAAEPVLT